MNATRGALLAVTWLCAVLVALPVPSAAQQVDPPVPVYQGRAFPRPATAAEVVLGNVLIGGLTAATHAAILGKNPLRAFSLGALGGAVHVAGKNLAVEPGAVNGWLGLALAGTGTSIVSNAGRNLDPFHEVSLPFASARVRWTPHDAKKVRFTVNAVESGLIIAAFLTEDLRFDWSKTASSGAVVFNTTRSNIVLDGERKDGMAAGPVVLISTRPYDPDRILRHEIVHVYQHWFASEAWDRPIEHAFRPKLPGARFIPSWIEFGVVAEAIWSADRGLFGQAGLRAISEAEAYRLEKR